MKEINNKDIAQVAIFTALIYAMALVPNVGYITVGPVGVTPLHAVTILFILLAPRDRVIAYGAIYGFIFGGSSLLIAYQRGSILFQNPLISVLPRIIFGTTTALMCKSLVKIDANEKVVCVITALIGTAVHTTAVLFAIGLFGSNWTALQSLFVAATVFNFPVEIAVAVALSLASPRIKQAIK